MEESGQVVKNEYFIKEKEAEWAVVLVQNWCKHFRGSHRHFSDFKSAHGDQWVICPKSICYWWKGACTIKSHHHSGQHCLDGSICGVHLSTLPEAATKLFVVDSWPHGWSFQHRNSYIVYLCESCSQFLEFLGTVIMLQNILQEDGTFSGTLKELLLSSWHILFFFSLYFRLVKEPVWEHWKQVKGSCVFWLCMFTLALSGCRIYLSGVSIWPSINFEARWDPEQWQCCYSSAPTRDTGKNASTHTKSDVLL